MPKSAEEQFERYYAKDRSEWCNWLLNNHASTSGIWLIYYKKESGKPRVSYANAVEEALCFGWIDSRPNAIDDESYMQLFSPRKPKSPWSKLNKQRVEVLIQQGLMMPAGIEKIEAAKRDGSWNVYDAVEELTVPNELLAALAQNSVAQQRFEAFSNTDKKQILWWIESAKREETRNKRVEQIVAAAEQGKNLLNYRANRKS